MARKLGHDLEEEAAADAALEQMGDNSCSGESAPAPRGAAPVPTGPTAARRRPPHRRAHASCRTRIRKRSRYASWLRRGAAARLMNMPHRSLVSAGNEKPLRKDALSCWPGRLKMVSMACGGGGGTDSEGRAPRASLSSSQARGCAGSEQTASQPAARRAGMGSVPLRATSLSGCSASLSGIHREEEVVQRTRMLDPLHPARARPSYRYWDLYSIRLCLVRLCHAHTPNWRSPDTPGDADSRVRLMCTCFASA